MYENNNFNQNNTDRQAQQQYVQPYVQQPEKPKKKKRTTAAVAASIAAVIIVSGGAGFGGAYIANKTSSPAIVSEDGGSSSKYTPPTSETPTLNDMQQNVSTGTSDARSGEVEFNTDGTYMYTRDLVNAVKNSVVSISNYINTGYQEGYSKGSGIVISNDGYIITNNHVISDGVDDCEVTVTTTAADGSESEEVYKAKLVGTDERTDLAVLKIDAQNLTAAKLGDSDKLSLGDDIVIIGNPVLISSDVVELTTSISKGVVSGLNREISATGQGLTSIQTDATINGGNSGGAMFNGYGEVVGIVDFKIVGDNTENLGFGITINEAKQVVEDLISKGYVSGRAMLGIIYQNITQSTAYFNGLTPGLYVTEIKSDYPVAKSGLVAGDTITEIDGDSVLTNDISTILAGKKPGDTVVLTVVRSDGMRKREVNITVELGEYKGE